MATTIVYFNLGIGLLLLFGGGEALVRGAVGLARAFRVSPLVIGLTIVGAATSSPELMVCLDAAMSGRPAIAVGNVVGSNIANILLVLGVGALAHPMRTNRRVVVRDGVFMIACCLVVVAAAFQDAVPRWQGALMIVGLAGYLAISLWIERDHRSPVAARHVGKADAVGVTLPGAWFSSALVIVGLGALLLGADLFIDGAGSLARALGVSDAVIGLSLVAVGTSLPELVTAIMAARSRHADVAIGNVIGSNIFNSLGILGATALVEPIPIDGRIVSIDLWVMLAASLAVVPFLVSDWRLSRAEGGLLLAGYVVYVVWMFQG
jgi:cation:H+ antiporter